jgi:hypothetical protein
MGDGDCTERSGSGSWSGDNRLAGCNRPPQPNLDATGRYESTTVNFLQPAIFLLLTNRHIGAGGARWRSAAPMLVARSFFACGVVGCPKSLMASMSSQRASSSSTPRSNYYNVFLSFYGQDTCHSFTDHLYAALKRLGIFVFRDNEKLKRGLRKIYF